MKKFKNKSILVTGGLGFIGSSLAIRLANCGAKVTVIDNLLENHGANFFNINPVKNKVKVNLCDIRNEKIMRPLIKNQDYIFHLAGQVSHVLSFSNPYLDIDINVKGTISLLEALKKENPNCLFIYGGTRGQYGKTKNPAKETDSSSPTGIHEISHLAAEQIILNYHRVRKIPVVLTRLTNIYGPRAQMKHNKYCVANWFVRLAIQNQTIPLFAQGKILRDFLYVDDCTEALLLLSTNKKAVGKIFNIASGKPTSFLELTKIIIKKSKSGNYCFQPFSFERKAQEVGDFWADISKIKRYTGWSPKINLSSGIEKTVEYYKKNQKHYF